MRNMVGPTKLDKWLFIKLEKHSFDIFISLLLLISLAIRLYFMPFTEMSSDYTGCLYPWWDEYKQYGIIGGLGRTIGNYYVPYNIILAFASLFPMQPCYIIASFSILADYVIAFYIYKILTTDSVSIYVSEKKAKIISTLVLFIPCVLMNGALWKQCDSIYTSFVIISIYYLVEEKYNRGLLFFSLGFVFKLQAVFILPIYFMIYVVKKKISLLSFLIIPAVYFIAGLPAILCGRGFAETYSVYFTQTDAGKSMMSNTTNIYEFMYSDPEICVVPALLFTLIVLVSVIWLFYYVKAADNKMLLMMAAWIPWTCFMFLPRMRQRYDYMAIVLFTVYILAFEFKAGWSVIIVNVISAMAYSAYLFKAEYPIMERTIPYVGIYMLFTTYVVNELIQCYRVNMPYEKRNL